MRFARTHGGGPKAPELRVARAGTALLLGLALGVLFSPLRVLWADQAAQGSPAQGSTHFSVIYEDVSRAVVGIRCLGTTPDGRQAREYYGTGTILDPGGLVLTSSTVVPADGRKMRVYIKGGRVLRARRLHSDPKTELVLLKVRADNVADLPYMKLGDSFGIRVGDPAFTLGNAFRSIEQDDQVSLSAGIVSGYFHLTEEHFQSRYTGLAIETSAPINNGMDGGPLLDREGRLVGLLSLNYSRNRWLGTAVPVHLLKPLLSPLKGWFSDRDQSFKAFAGVELEEVRDAEIRVLRVDTGGPAETAGLLPGMAILRADHEDLPSLTSFRDLFAEKLPGEVLELRIRHDGKTRDVRLTLLGKF